MQKRCIVNLACRKPYTDYQDRLLNSIQPYYHNNEFDVAAWTDSYPKNSPDHQTLNYGFKIHVIEQAIQAGYTQILWLDAACYAEKSPKEIFDIIEEQGYYFVQDDNRLGNWISDYVLDLFGCTRDELMDYPLLSGTIYGFNLENETGRKIWEEFREWYYKGSFMGAYINDSVKTDVIHDKNRDKSVGHVSNDPRCKGHRHDETTLAFLTRKYNCKLDSIGNLFQGSVIKANKW